MRFAEDKKRLPGNRPRVWPTVDGGLGAMVSVVVCVKRHVLRHEPTWSVGDVTPTYRIAARSGIATYRRLPQPEWPPR
jgi:hypothetical protein